MAGLLAYIGGSERCGSTMLDLILNNNPQIQAVGEVSRLCWYARTNHETCTCGEPVTKCPFWLAVEALGRQRLGATRDDLLTELETMLRPEEVGRVADRVQKLLLVMGNRPLYLAVAPWLTRAHHEACKNSLFWYDVIREHTGTSVLLDSSKDARRLKALYLTEPRSFRLILLMRDGRAIVASAVRRKKISLERAIRDWVTTMRSLSWASSTIPDSQVCRVRYESICADPAGSVARICEFLGVPFDPAMIELRKDVAHDIGGNPMRFRTTERRIRLDERWREELTADDLQVFERLAGNWNKRIGYRD